jgi:hypothetical protein
MKKRKIAFLAGLLACAVAGVATASALIVSGPASPAVPPSGSMDEILYLSWGDTNSTGQIANLTPSMPAYRVVSVAEPEKSASAPDGKFTATLAEDTTVEKHSINGVTVFIYDAPYKENGDPGDGATKIGELKTGSLSASKVVTEAETYYIKVTLSDAAYQSYIGDNPQYVLAGIITFSLGANVQVQG